jgi:hypothetical protein
MRLIHHDKQIIKFDPDRLYPNRDHDQYFKPHGLWVSDEDDYGWSHWCTAEEFAQDSLAYEHLVELAWDNNVLVISTVPELDKFHEQFKASLGDWETGNPRWLNWTRVHPLWQGIIITPYLWERRMDYMWYYGWDCASGCIWDLRAIRTFTPLLKQLTGGNKQ